MPTAELQSVHGFAEQAGKANHAKLHRLEHFSSAIRQASEDPSDAGTLDSMWLDVGGEG